MYLKTLPSYPALWDKGDLVEFIDLLAEGIEHSI